jgi:hypothetical protein
MAAPTPFAGSPVTPSPEMVLLVMLACVPAPAPELPI